MATTQSSERRLGHRSIVFKNVVLFLLILLVAVVPLALRYYQDSRDYEIETVAARLEFFAERGASWLDAEAITTLTEPDHKSTPAYQDLLKALQRIKEEFGVDNAIVMRRQENLKYMFIAAGHDGFDIGQPVFIHEAEWFPATYKATNATWELGEMMHSQLFGGPVLKEGLSSTMSYLCRLLSGFSNVSMWQQMCSQRVFDRFLQINNPLKIGDKVVAVLMLNKDAESVAQAVRAKTLAVIGLSSGIVAVGLALFGAISAGMLRPLKTLTRAAGDVAQGNLDIEVPPPRSQDEVGRLSESFEGMVEGLRQRDFIRDTFGRYISKEVVEELLGSPDGLKLGGELREVTFLVSDLRGFSAMVARLSPHTVIDIINRYLERMIEIITRYRGTVDEFQGDGILAFFGAPLAAGDDAERAVACALEMQIALLEINAEQRRLDLPELAMGIGLNVGEVIVGNIGSEQRTKYGAMGTPINTAYRIESYTVAGQILISPSVHERVESLVQLRGSMEVQFKGVPQPVTVYDVGGLGGSYQLSLPEKVSETFIALTPPLAIACYPLDGKTIAEEAISGCITDLTSSSAKALLQESVSVHNNVKLNLTPEDETKLEVYAKVLALEPTEAEAEDRMVLIEFTSVADDAKRFLEDRCKQMM